jgi:WS/DGAT/MGAT family acyltransferase
MSIMPLNDSMFLLAESREHPLHVGALQLFEPPEDAGPDYLGALHRKLVRTEQVRTLFRRRPQPPVGSLGQWAWRQDNQLDLEYHVRLSALPKPGRVRELLELTSRLHGSLLDRHRPLWEMHLIEGLESNRFAIYTKMHHALTDGVSALRLIERALSTDPDEIVPGAVFASPPKAAGSVPVPGPRAGAAAAGGLFDIPKQVARRANGIARTVSDIAGVGPALVNKVVRGTRERSETLPYAAPRSMLNVPITGARRYAAQGWSMDRIKAIRASTGSTLNDVVLAMCSGALRHYLLDEGALPDQPLVAMVPVSVRKDESAQGNSLGVILCELATDATDPAARLARITESMAKGKAAFAGMSPLQVMLMSAFSAAGLAFQPIPGVPEMTRPPFNVIISNVPGPREPLYFNGARMTGLYPVSLPYDGQALNITCTSYAGSLEFGLTGCRRSVPHLQRMLGHLDTALVELEHVAGVA